MQRVSRMIGRIFGWVPWKPILIWGPWVVIVLLVGFYTEENWRGARAWEKVRAELAARGVKLDVADFMPESVPDGENFVMHPIVLEQENSATALYSPHGDTLKGFSTANEDYRHGKMDFGTQWDVSYWLAPAERVVGQEGAARRCLELMGPMEAPMEAFAEAVRRPGCRFRLDGGGELYGRWMDPAGFNLLGASRAFQYRATLFLRVGEVDAAFADLSVIFSLVEKLRADPTTLGGLIEMRMVMEARKIVWDGLKSGSWTDAQLGELAEIAATMNYMERVHQVMCCEAAFMVETYKTTADDRMEIVNASYAGAYWVNPLDCLVGSSTPGWWDTGVDVLELGLCYLIPKGWFDLWLADGLSRIDQCVLLTGGEGVANREMVVVLQDQVAALKEMPMGSMRVYQLKLMGRVTRRGLLVQTDVHLMEIAIALERYRMRMGTYPPNLAALVPMELLAVPEDLMSGGPLLYELKADGTPLIYSVGLNGKDDGGVPAKRVDDLDWVWQYTGTVGQTERMWGMGKAP